MSLFIIGALAGTAVVKIGERNPNMSDGKVVASWIGPSALGFLSNVPTLQALSAGYVLGWFNAAGMSGI